MDIKPIETCYNGYRFRSRLEARWAVFFDAIGIKYLYENEGFDLGDGIYYLPDFYLPDANQFFEVKADIKNIPENERAKINRLADASGKYVIVGDSYFRLTGDEPMYPAGLPRKDTSFCCSDTYLVRCNDCKTLYFENEMSYQCTACGVYDGDSTFQYVSGCNGDLEYATKEYISAIYAARQARFEHGESPDVGRREQS